MKTGYLGTGPEAYNTAALQSYVKEFPPAAVARDQLGIRHCGTVYLSDRSCSQIAGRRHPVGFDRVKVTSRCSWCRSEAG